MTDQRKATSDISAKDEGEHVQELPAGHAVEHFQDHIALLVFGKCEGFDVAVIIGMYHVGGKVWGVKDALLQQTQVIISPSGQRTMENNDFVGNRFSPLGNYIDNFKVTQEADKVTWAAGNRTIAFKPPYWELKGEHMGVDVNLRIGGIGKSIPYHGPWSNLAAHAAAGNEHLGWAEGSFTHKGKTYTLEEGWAVRERTCFGKGRDVVSLLGSRGYLWGWSFSEAIKIFCFAQPESKTFVGRVFVGDQMIDFLGQDAITVVPKEEWKDPMTGVSYPISWKITMKSDKGTAEMDVATWARSICGFHMATGYTTHHCNTGRTSGKFTFPDGKVVPINESLTYFEQGKGTPLSVG